MYIRINAVELAKKRRLIVSGNKSLLFPLMNIFIDKSDLVNIIQSFSGELMSTVFLYKLYIQWECYMPHSV